MISNDLIKWLVPTMLISVGFSVAFSILCPSFHQGSEFQVRTPKLSSRVSRTLVALLLPRLPSTPLSRSLARQLADTPGPLRPFDFAHISIDLSAGGPFFLPFWALYGFFEPGELGAAPSSASVTPVVLWVYLMVSVVLFINLLIAMFNDRYRLVTDRADAQWKMSRVHKVKSYMQQYPVPPPFNVPFLLFELLLAFALAVGRAVLAALACRPCRALLMRARAAGAATTSSGVGGQRHGIGWWRHVDFFSRAADDDGGKEPSMGMTSLQAEAAEKAAMESYLKQCPSKTKAESFEAEVLSQLERFREMLSNSGRCAVGSEGGSQPSGSIVASSRAASSAGGSPNPLFRGAGRHSHAHQHRQPHQPHHMPTYTHSRPSSRADASELPVIAVASVRSAPPSANGHQRVSRDRVAAAGDSHAGSRASPPASLAASEEPASVSEKHSDDNSFTRQGVLRTEMLTLRREVERLGIVLEKVAAHHHVSLDGVPSASSAVLSSSSCGAFQPRPSVLEAAPPSQASAPAEDGGGALREQHAVIALASCRGGAPGVPEAGDERERTAAAEGTPDGAPTTGDSVAADAPSALGWAPYRRSGVSALEHHPTHRPTHSVLKTSQATPKGHRWREAYRGVRRCHFAPPAATGGSVASSLAPASLPPPTSVPCTADRAPRRHDDEQKTRLPPLPPEELFRPPPVQTGPATPMPITPRSATKATGGVVDSYVDPASGQTLYRF